MSKTTTTRSTSSWQTTVREVYVEPLLPPPIIQSIRTLDATIHESIGISEATITILVTVFLAWILYQGMGWWMTHPNSRSHIQRRAIKENKTKSKGDMMDERDQQQQPQYDATVLFTGPRNSGKTRLFYQFLQYHTTTTNQNQNQNQNTTDAGTAITSSSSSSPILTVMSLQTNIDYVTIAAAKTEHSFNKSSNEAGNDIDQHSHEPPPPPQVIRLIDYPGHASVYDATYIQIITPTTTTTRTGYNQKVSSSSSSSLSPPLRMVLVVDATQPVTTAAELLFQLFTLLHDLYIHPPTNNNKKNKVTSSPIPSEKPCIFVACHKKDILKKAKNEKRIKIQIRTELERLIYHHSVLQTNTALNNSHEGDGNSRSGTNNSTATTGWWCCPPPPPQSSTAGHHTPTTSMNANNSNNHISSINPFTIAVDFDELPFVQLFFHATTCCEDTISRELFEFCTTGTVKSSS